MNIQAFKKNILSWYAKEGRHDLPWRKTKDPYKILVSEIMLQQTQVVRVKEKYKEFLQRFPTVQALANAPLGEVLSMWSGLGYNRRAKFLKQCAEYVVGKYNGKFPKTITELKQLPGVGSYTAGAVAAFAYNSPSVCIETNIRTVYIHHFFPQRAQVSDRELLPLIERTLDVERPRDWYWALMDYGAHLKTKGVHTNRVSKHYTKQSPFKGSRREIRGAIIKTLVEKPRTQAVLLRLLPFAKDEILSALSDLQREKLVTVNKGAYSL